VVFRGSKTLCHEFSLVLEAKSIEHEVLESAGSWELTVPPALIHPAYDEISRYSAERRVPRATPKLIEPFGGAAIGALGYVLVLLLAAYCAGIGLFSADWLSLGALEAGAGREWWRAVTALTLHVDQEHLLGNLLFGVFAGIAAGRACSDPAWHGRAFWARGRSPIMRKYSLHPPRIERSVHPPPCSRLWGCSPDWRGGSGSRCASAAGTGGRRSSPVSAC
jgi:hypothetical protein